MTPALILKNLGLNDKETALYLALLKRGRATPGQLAKMTRINRATVYTVARSLQGKGLVGEDLAGKTLHLVALPIAHMRQSIEREKRELDMRADQIDEAVREFSLVSSKEEYLVPKMRFVPDYELKDFLFANMRKWQQSALSKDGVWWGFQDHTFVEHYEEWIHATWETPEAKAGCKGHVVSNISEAEQKLLKKYPKEARNVRTIKDMRFQSTLWVAGDYVVMVMTHQRPHYLYEIHDPLLAANLREVCKTLWAQARE